MPETQHSRGLDTLAFVSFLIVVVASYGIYVSFPSVDLWIRVLGMCILAFFFTLVNIAVSRISSHKKH
jgi:uncharacterized protein YqfA (UPF0365 family)